MGSAIAADIDPIAQTKALLDQYSARVRSLEAENAILREEMRKAGIKIPLSAYSGVVQTNNIPVVSDTPIATATTSTVTGTTLPVVTTSGEINFSEIEKIHGPVYTGFIKRIISEWDKVRDAYLMPKNAHIGGYELVVTGALDHVFVDIVYTGSITGTGIYDAKILYQFDKKTFARKLIGFFEYNPTTGYYITRTGKNIFPGVTRTFVLDPRVIALSQANLPTTVPTTTSTSTSVTTTSYADIEAAYTAKRFLSVITLSNTWLASNAPNLEVLRIRYRTYFIIAKYAEALKEIEKIRAIGQLSSAVACE